MINYDDLDKGIRGTVKWLHEQGYTTTDSGDGTKSEEMDCAVDFPMIVVMLSFREQYLSDIDNLWKKMNEAGFDMEKISIESAYKAGEDSKYLAVLLAFDGLLNWEEEDKGSL